MTDPYLQIRGRGRSSRPRDKGGAFGPQFGPKIRGGGGGLPGRSPGSATVKDTVKLKIRKYLSPGAYIVQRPFLRGLSMEGNLHLKFESLPFLLCSTLYLRAISKYKLPRGLIFGGAI